MKVLVTGANGFLGSAIVRHLLDAGHSVKCMLRAHSRTFTLEGLDIEEAIGDIRNAEAVDNAVQGCDIVIHTASTYSFTPWWDKKALRIYDINVGGTKHVLEASLRRKVKRFIFTSSIAAIGQGKNNSFSDESLELDISKSKSHYAKSKALAELEVAKVQAKGLSCVILNPAILIGPRDYRPTPSGEVIVKFLNKKYPCYFDANMSLADVDDVAKAHLLAIDKGRAGQRYILCNNETYTLKDFFNLLSEVSGIPAPKISMPYPLLLSFIYIEELLSYFILHKKPYMSTEGVKFCRIPVKYDNSKAREELGYTVTPIKESIKKAVDWYKDNGYVK